MTVTLAAAALLLVTAAGARAASGPLAGASPYPPATEAEHDAALAAPVLPGVTLSSAFVPDDDRPGRPQPPEPVGAAAFGVALGLLILFRLQRPRR